MAEQRRAGEYRSGLRSYAALGLAAALSLAACGHEIEETGWESSEATGSHHAAVTTCGGQPATPALFSRAIEDYAAYDGQETCLSTEQPGVVAFRDLVMATYPCTWSGGILRDCDSGGTSEHKEGRAWDWMVNVGDRAPEDLLAWLLAPDAEGNAHAMARRLGLMYVVWNYRIWRSYRAEEGWTPYTGTSPHTDHVHFSFSWAGALEQTSFWGGTGSAPPPPPPTTEEDPPVGTALCGDGVLDPGEFCDWAITSGPGVCPVGCDDGDPCTREEVSGSPCNPQCLQVFVDADSVMPDGCCPPGATRGDDADCYEAAPCQPGSPGCGTLANHSPTDQQPLMGGCRLGPDSRGAEGGAAVALLASVLLVALRRRRRRG